MSKTNGGDADDGDSGGSYTSASYFSLVVMAGAIALGAAVVLLFAWSTPAAPLLLVGGAAVMLGGLIGFLFGIPRRLQREAEPKPATDGATGANAPAASRSLYEGNTNLEQISDWLTKILVGVGLVEFTSISDKLGTVSSQIADALGGPIKAPVVSALIIYFFVCGFLIGYLWARLFLGRALTEAERVDRLERKVSKFEQQARADARAIALATRQISEGDGSVDDAELKRAVKAASSDIRAYVFYRGEYHRYQNWKNDKRAMERAIPIFRALIAADEKGEFHRNYGQLGYALKDKREPDLDEANEKLSQAIRLRGEGSTEWPSYEANRAIVRIMLGDKFEKGFASSEGATAAILADLKLGFADPWTRPWVSTNEAVVRWLEQKHIDPATLIPAGADQAAPAG